MFKGTNSTPKLYSTLTCLHPTGETGCHCLIHTTGQTGHTDRSDWSSQNRGDYTHSPQVYNRTDSQFRGLAP